MLKTETVFSSPKWHFYVSLLLVVLLIGLFAVCLGLFLIAKASDIISIFCLAVFAGMILFFSYLCYGICCCKNDQISVGHDGVKVKLHVGFKFQLLETVLPIGKYKIQCTNEHNRRVLTVYDQQNAKVFDYHLDYAFSLSHACDIINALASYHSITYSGESESETLAKTGLKGPVRKVTHYYVDCSHGSFNKAEKLYETIYDENGEPIEDFFYNEKGNEEKVLVYQDGELEYTIRKQYNEHGNLVTTESTDKQGVKIYNDISEYDTANNIVSFRSYDRGTLCEEKKYTNNNLGHCIREERICYSDGIPSETVTVYDTDEYGNFLSAKVYENGKQIGAEFRSYDYYE